MASFQRQLNLYGFHRVPYGQDRGSYYHECFLQGRPSLALRITPVKVPRTRIKRTGKILVEKEPNFYALPPVNVLGLPRSREEADQLSRECNGLSDDRSDDNPSLDDIVTELFFEDDGVDIDMVQDFCSDWMPRNKQPVDWNG